MRYLWPIACLTLTLGATAASCGGSGEEGTASDNGGGTPTGSAHGGGGASPGTSAGGSSGGLIITDAGTDGSCSHAKSCADLHANCGMQPDGCDQLMDCGTCHGGDSCGGGQEPNRCGHASCTPMGDCTGLDCGDVSDGCGGLKHCGDCTGNETCGGGGEPGVCGVGTCTPVTDCTVIGADCGMQPDGCGHTVDCGTCTFPNTCGGSGHPSVCGVPVCNPQTLCAAGQCGPVNNGCNGVLVCGGCSLPERCGGLVASECGVPAACTNLCLLQTTCPPGNMPPTTQLSGTVYAPNGTDPLPNVLVYVPNAAVTPFPTAISCDKCSDGVSGSPLVSAVTDTHGNFTITNMPVGANIPVVLQTGRWRRQLVLPSTTGCVDNVAGSGSLAALPANFFRLPRTKLEGDIPHMAFVTGSVDALECVVRKIGVADSEFTKSTGTGRIHLYLGNDGGAANAGVSAGSGTASEQQLWGSMATLRQYDMVLMPCQGNRFNKTSPVQTTGKANLHTYANEGGRLFATHYSYVWLQTNGDFANAAQWSADQTTPTPDPQTGHVNQSFPKGQALAEWLHYVQLPTQTTLGDIPISVLRKDTNGVIAPTTDWIDIDNPAGTVMHMTFNTPVTAAPADQCGRVLFDDFHVEDRANNSTNGKVFPTECDALPLTPQEKLLEFMIFDLGSCVTPDIPVCVPTTCAAQGIACGPAGDGCGDLIDNCGDCPSDMTCGGGGMPGQCGTPQCAPSTCLDEGIGCGPAGDGCGRILDCGSCPTGQTCGGGGNPSHCGSGTCTKLTCAGQGVACGPAGDGCGGLLACGDCPSGETCGGGGVAGQCGNSCTKLTCAGLGFTCGQAGDGCGGVLDCGTCTAPQTCGGGGVPNTCGGSTPH